MLAEKTNESDAILAKHVCLPFVPRFVGATRCEGGRSPSKRNSFSEGPGQIVCGVQKAQPAICRGNRNPAGLELASEAAERGNCPEAKPNEERLKGRRACKKSRVSMRPAKITTAFGRPTQRRLASVFRAETKRDAPKTVIFRVCGVTRVPLVPRSNDPGRHDVAGSI
jgi:hypothetical protein